MSTVFDGMPDIFAGTFGETVVYTPIATGTPATIVGIPIDEPIDVNFSDGSDGDTVRRMLHFRTADVTPAEGDLALINGVTWKVVTPFLPDGKGMVAVTLARRS